MKLIRSTLISLLTVSICLATALEVEEAFQAKAYKTPEGKSLNYRIHIPAPLDPEKNYPLVLFFHGAKERGNDNTKQLKHDIKNILAYATKNKEPVIIIAPQCPSRMQWVNTPWGADSHIMPKSPSEPMRLTIELLQKTIEEQPIELKRIYVTGMSMGGFGTWDLIQRKPEMFTAAIPICGDSDPQYANQIMGIPIWIFHGDKDKVVKTARSRDMIEAIKKAGGTLLYTKYPNTGHDSWTKTYADEKVLKWLFQQTK